MPLPSFKSKKAQAGAEVIDVKVKPVKEPKAKKSAAAPAVPRVDSICKDLAPSFDKTNRPSRLQLSPSMRVLPAAIILMAAAAGGYMGCCAFTSSQTRASIDQVKLQIKQTNAQTTAVAEELNVLNNRFEVAEQVLLWSDQTTAFQPILVAVAQACKDRVQINTLGVEQKDRNSLRLTLTFQATGDPKKFGGIQEDLIRALDKLGWAIDANPTVTGPQYNYIGILTRSR